ncbi:MAG: UTRA domain-containing protein [SAR324 cluster bacterium]|nr:UTRA domain-containing protein [SAR324 cluster bacterium]
MKKSFSEQIKEYICSKIETGTWPCDFQIPSESALMEKFSVSRMTVNRVLKELVIAGMIYRKRGKGSFVQGKIPRENLLEIHDIADEIQKRGSSYFSVLKYLSAEQDSPLISHVFGTYSKQIVRSKIVHYENGLPLQLEDRYVNTLLAPDYLKLDFKATTAHQYLMKVAPLQKAEHQLTAVMANREVQEFLLIPSSEPCLLLKRKTWSNDMVASYAELFYPSSRYSFGGWMLQNGRFETTFIEEEK